MSKLNKGVNLVICHIINFTSNKAPRLPKSCIFYEFTFEICEEMCPWALMTFMYVRSESYPASNCHEAKVPFGGWNHYITFCLNELIKPLGLSLISIFRTAFQTAMKKLQPVTHSQNLWTHQQDGACRLQADYLRTFTQYDAHRATDFIP